MILLGIKVRENSLILNTKFNTGFFDQENFRVVSIKRGPKTIIPIGTDQILANDIVYFMKVCFVILSTFLLQ